MSGSAVFGVSYAQFPVGLDSTPTQPHDLYLVVRDLAEGQVGSSVCGSGSIHVSV